MRLNRFIARAEGCSRRQADELIAAYRVTVNGRVGQIGQRIESQDIVALDGKRLELEPLSYLLLNKPPGYISSRRGQGAATIYELLPKQYRHLKPVGRLDKDSRGLMLLTNDGELAQKLTHPRFTKEKVYRIELDKELAVKDIAQIARGVKLEDGLSRLTLTPRNGHYRVSMREGRNRQIRRTFAALGYTVTDLKRTRMGEFKLGDLPEGEWRRLSRRDLPPLA